MNVLKWIVVLIMGVLPLPGYSQTSYEDWEDHDVIKFYGKIDLEYNTLSEEGEDISIIYVPSKIDDGTYEVEVYKVSNKLYQIRGTNIYMLFRYSPYLYNYDEGVLSVSYNSGTFYKKP